MELLICLAIGILIIISAIWVTRSLPEKRARFEDPVLDYLMTQIQGRNIFACFTRFLWRMMKQEPSLQPRLKNITNLAEFEQLLNQYKTELNNLGYQIQFTDTYGVPLVKIFKINLDQADCSCSKCQSNCHIENNTLASN